MVKSDQLNIIANKLNAAFSECSKPPDDCLISVGGIDSTDAYVAFSGISRLEIEHMTGIDETISSYLENLGSDARRYYMPSVLCKILLQHRESTPWAIELVLAWLRRSLSPSRGATYFGISLTKKQIDAIRLFCDAMPGLILENEDIHGDWLNIQNWSKTMTENLDNAKSLQDFDK